MTGALETAKKALRAFADKDRAAILAHLARNNKGFVNSEYDRFLARMPLAMAVAIMFLELMVAFLQAFIFTLLASVFIGLVRESHH